MKKRHLERLITEALKEFPVVLLIGARQVGKTTLAKAIASGAWNAAYYSLDDRSVLDAALGNPDGFIRGNPPPMVIDEIQRAPDLMRAVKLAVDSDRKPGMYLLTGSANPLRLKSVPETLAGRVAVFELDSFSWAEIDERKPPVPMLNALMECNSAAELLSRISTREVNPRREDIKRLVLTGGYPDPVRMKTRAVREKWFDSYRQTYLERDVRDITSVADLPAFGRLLRVLALRTGNLLNLMDVSRDLGITYTTLRRYVGVLETTFQVDFMRPYQANIAKRLVKTPKLYFNDTGMACSLAGVDGWATLEKSGLSGRMLETWVSGELRKTLPFLDAPVRLMFWREQHGGEVDFVLEKGMRLAGVEVKSSESVTSADLKGPESFLEATSDKSGIVVVLHPGEMAFAPRERIASVPMSLFFGAEGRLSSARF
ncbi:MAG: ATP-binding protein [Actinobacteria bacterium]|nr:ATP-binding protein [Actinomycetota bacterium]MBU4218685.1 ATP-binding protein [Actinomycetota bacterium]MBU4359292.1 ATP-binding protein [Actinomycetota bacterium]MBU4392138.1 ATP-binding protein [Actinomycetota bacterium]MBU4403746.1 ATP-binding protein [Actinomycetota bacterium]